MPHGKVFLEQLHPDSCILKITVQTELDLRYLFEAQHKPCPHPALICFHNFGDPSTPSAAEACFLRSRPYKTKQNLQR